MGGWRDDLSFKQLDSSFGGWWWLEPDAASQAPARVSVIDCRERRVERKERYTLLYVK